MSDKVEAVEVKRGRPPGSVETPDKLMWQELIAHAKLYKRLRELVDKRLNAGEIPSADLINYMDAIRRGVTELARALSTLQKPAAETAADEFDPEKFMKELEGTK